MPRCCTTTRRPTASCPSPTSSSTARTTPGSTPACRRRRSRAPGLASLASGARPCRHAVPVLRALRGRRAPRVRGDRSPSTRRTASRAVSERARPAGARRLGGSTRVVGVIGWPVEHSLSPAIHNAAFAALGLDWVYVPMPVPPARCAGRGRGAAGARLRRRERDDAAQDRACAERRRRAVRGRTRVLGAVNTIVVGADAISGHNTDVAGFDRFLRRGRRLRPSGSDARSCSAPAGRRAPARSRSRAAGSARLTVAVRDPSRADGAPRRRSRASARRRSRRVVRRRRTRSTADLVVNATPLGAARRVAPAAAARSRTCVGRRPRCTARARRRSRRPCVAAGGTAFGGLGLLLQQAAIAFELWTGQPAPLEVMSAAALAELQRTLGTARALGGPTSRGRSAEWPRPQVPVPVLPMVSREHPRWKTSMRSPPSLGAGIDDVRGLPDPFEATGWSSAAHPEDREVEAQARVDPFRRARRSRARVRPVRDRDLVLRAPRPYAALRGRRGPACVPGS